MDKKTRRHKCPFADHICIVIPVKLLSQREHSDVSWDPQHRRESRAKSGILLFQKTEFVLASFRIPLNTAVKMSLKCCDSWPRVSHCTFVGHELWASSDPLTLCNANYKCIALAEISSFWVLASRLITEQHWRPAGWAEPDAWPSLLTLQMR